MDWTIYLELFRTFFLIGMFTIGGGYAMLSLIQTQTVSLHGWISESEFADIVGISQMTPGPVGINTATYVGYSVLHGNGGSEFSCIMGSFCATFAVVLPSFLIMLLIVRLYTKLNSNNVFKSVMSGLRPSVVGLIGAAALILIFQVSFTDHIPHLSVMKENFPDFFSWIIFALAFVLSMWTRVSPIAVITGAGVLGFLFY